MTNALVTGSRKYGSPRLWSNTDVILFVTEELRDDLWCTTLSHDDEARFIMFDQVKFIEAKDGDVIVNYHHLGVDIYCRMSEADRDLVGELHKWVKVEGSQAFTSTYRNNAVNIIPVVDPERWQIWLEGTEALEAAKPVDRRDAIDFFNTLGMPRFDSQ